MLKKFIFIAEKKKVILKKVEPWNSVRVTFNIPRDAAQRLKLLAQQGDSTLKQLGVLAVQIDGDQSISLTIAGRNNERTQLVFHTAERRETPTSVRDAGGTSKPGGTMDVTQKNITDYLQQGSHLSMFGSLFGQQTLEPDNMLSGFGSEHSTSKFGVSTSVNNKIPSQSVRKFPLTSGLENATSLGQVSTGSGHNISIPSGSVPGDSSQDLPPPPPYPHSSAFLNNIAKNVRLSQQGTPSPLLVNLLQNEPSLANINNFINSKMLPPPQASPPIKKKRKPRKPKEKKASDGNQASATVTSESDLDIPMSMTPDLSSVCAVPLVTSGSSSNMPTIPMVTQALPANTQPVVTYSSQGRPSVYPVTTSSMAGSAFPFISSLPTIPMSQEGVQRRVDVELSQYLPDKDFQHLLENDMGQYLPENTAGKIINPYTGLLEPVDNLSDSSPNKSDTSVDGFSPHKRKISPKKNSSQKRNIVNNARHPDQLKGDARTHVPITSTGFLGLDPLKQHKQAPSLDINSYIGKDLGIPASFHSSLPSQGQTGKTSMSSAMQNANTYRQTMSQYHASKSSYHGQYDMPTTSNYVSQHHHAPSATPSIDLSGMRSTFSVNSTKPEFVPLHQSLYKSMTESELEVEKRTAATCVQVSTSIETASLPHHIHKSVKPAICTTSLTSPHSELLLNKPIASHSHTSKTNTAVSVSRDSTSVGVARDNTTVSVASGNGCTLDSPGGDSENSSQSSLLHDQPTTNELPTPGCSLETETKSYNHDSGVGSSSERSDGTPSEPGDDFKANHVVNHEEYLNHSSKNCIETLTTTKVVAPKSEAHEITVGYATVNNVQRNNMHHNPDINSMVAMDKVLNHPHLNNFKHHNETGNKKQKVNHVDPSVTVLHWSTKDKIISNQVDNHKHKSPKQFLLDDSVPPPILLDGHRTSPYNTDFINIKLDPMQHVVDCKNPFG